MKVAAIILAAGQSRRMRAKNKLLEPWRGVPLLVHVLKAAKRSDCADVIVVTGHDQNSVAPLVTEHCPNAITVHNPSFAEGMGTSLAKGMSALPEQKQAVVVLLGDMPLVEHRHINALIHASAEQDDDLIIVASNGEEPGNPVLFGRNWFKTLAHASGDKGAREILKSEAPRLLVDIGPAARRDFDTPDAFESKS